ncbi:MAG: biphenyl 2,3-dioxygenase [Ardenticatenia bacterium]|jgi:3-phenylpropionate/trans-cinnamate dioxygenase ferredoxin subunit|nr:MAG: biphenyl 2,3-dioxygenase [Ardenticatenia bacterium]
MERFVRVARTTDLMPGQKMRVEYDGTPVGLFNIDGEYYAISDMCTHDGGPLVEGELQDDVIICPRHGARFDVRTGQVRSLPAYRPVPTYQVKVEDGDILIAPREED